MWVEVVDEGQARLRNRPLRLAALAIGDLVAFEPRARDRYRLQRRGARLRAGAVADRGQGGDRGGPGARHRGARGVRQTGGSCAATARSARRARTAGLLSDRFPGLEEPLRAGDGLWELAEGERADARWRRVGDDEIAASEEWPRLLAWLEKTAAVHRKSAP